MHACSHLVSIHGHSNFTRRCDCPRRAVKATEPRKVKPHVQPLIKLLTWSQGADSNLELAGSFYYVIEAMSKNEIQS